MLGDLAVGMTVLEQQRTCMRLQGHGGGDFESLQNLDQPVKPEPAPGNLWAEQCGVEVDIARPSPGNSNITAKQGSLKKRKLDRINGTEGDDESKQKTDYIHVRARRGQATDSHSLAERARREKISERMKYLQDLVPGCNKIIGKAGMLDEIINYVQSLQQQVEFLSMKLATVNPTMDWSIEDLFEKEAFLLPCTTSIPSTNVSPETDGHLNNAQPNPMHLSVQHLGMELGINSVAEHQAPLSSASPILEMLYDSSIFHKIIPSSAWEADLQNSYNVDFFLQGRATPLVSQQHTGSVEIGNMKIEM